MKKIINRKFSRDFEEVERYEAGIVLTGAEVKVIRAGGLRLEGAYVRMLEGGSYLVNAQIPAYKPAHEEGYDPKRSRKLLLNHKEIERIGVKIRGSGGLTIVPVSCYNKGDILKLEIALVRGRKGHEKKGVEKRKKQEKDQKREERRAL